MECCRTELEEVCEDVQEEGCALQDEQVCQQVSRGGGGRRLDCLCVRENCQEGGVGGFASLTPAHKSLVSYFKSVLLTLPVSYATQRLLCWEIPPGLGLFSFQTFLCSVKIATL